MKKIIFSLSCVALCLTALAQNYTLTPSKSLVYSIPADMNYADYQINIVNQKSTKLSVSWHLDQNSFLKGWDYSLCDYGTCFTGIPIQHKMDTINIGGSGFLKISMSPQGIDGTGEVRLLLFETGNPTVMDTLVYRITASAFIGVKEVSASTFLVYPNPANEFIYIKSGMHTAQQFSLYTLDGREVKSVLPDAGGRMDLSGVPPGNYFILMMDEQRRTFRQALIRN